MCIPPPPSTATSQQLYSLHYPVPPPKRRRADSPESLGAPVLMEVGVDCNVSMITNLYMTQHMGHCVSLETYRLCQRVEI